MRYGGQARSRIAQRRLTPVIVVLVIAAALPAIAMPSSDPTQSRVDLLTVGPGADLSARWGHASVCVAAPGVPDERGTCMNFGGGQFADPKVIPEALRGRAHFRSGPAPFHWLRRYYEAQDRALYRQRLYVDEPAVRRLRTHLGLDDRPTLGRHPFDVFEDNCTTRVRDAIDLALGGRLRAATSRRLFAAPYRALFAPGVASHPMVAYGVSLTFGPAVDRRPTVWQAMFLPDVLRAEVARLRDEAGRPVAAAVEVLAERRGPPLGSSPRVGAMVGYALAVALAAVVAALGWWPRWGVRIAPIVAGTVLGALGAFVWFIATMGVAPLLARNPNVLLLWPMDLALAILGIASPRPAWIRAALAYLGLRTAVAAGVLGAWLAGIVVSPVLPQVALVMATSVALALVLIPAARRSARPASAGAITSVPAS